MAVAEDLPNPLNPNRWNVRSREAKFFDDDYIALWNAKLQECHPRFIASIRREGIVEPVALRFLSDGVYLAEGHHRWVVASALHLLVPWVDAADPARTFRRDLPWADGFSAGD